MTVYNYKDYWRERTKTPDAIFNLKKQKDIENILTQLKFNTVLEPGCGSGQFSQIIKKFDCKLTGVDISNKRIKNNKFIDVGFEMNFINWLSHDKFDLVTCSHFLLHIKPEHINQVIKNIKSISKKHILFIEPHIIENLGKWQYYNFQYDYDKLMDKKSRFKQIDETTGIYYYEM